MTKETSAEEHSNLADARPSFPQTRIVRSRIMTDHSMSTLHDAEHPPGVGHRACNRVLTHRRHMPRIRAVRSAACILCVLFSFSTNAVADEPTEVGGVPVVDRVKSVQKKPFLKRGRLELAPVGHVSANDAFFVKMGGGLQLAWHLSDAFAVRGHFE